MKILQPNDQWNLEVFLLEWVKLLKIAPIYPLPKSKTVFIFSCYRGQITQDIVMALLLAWRGHTVKLGYFPKLQSPIKEPLEDHPSAAEYLDAILGKMSGLTNSRVECVNLSSYPLDSVPEDAYFSGQLRADIIMKLRREKFSENDQEVSRVREHYSRLGKFARGIATSFLRDHSEKIDLCLIANGASFENGYFCQAAKELGIPVNTHEKFAFGRARVITHGDAFFQFSDLDKIWKNRRKLGFLDEPFKTLLLNKSWELLNERRSNRGDSWGWKYQKLSHQLTETQLRSILGIEASQFVLVCPNVPFDAGYDGWLEMFSSMRDWLVETLEKLLSSYSGYVVVRAHPAETRPGFGSERISKIIEEAGLDSERLVLIEGGSIVNTYDLMPLCEFAVVFASTTGVEVAMHGKPVIAGASVYYARCGITVPVKDRNDYFKKLRELATGLKINTADNAEDAALLYFIFHYLLQWPFPYDKPSQISAMPLADLVQIDDLSRYIETIDVLAMASDDFDESLSILFNKNSIESRWSWKF